MADPMKIRAEMKGDVAEIRVLMNHPMETGQRKDAKTGQVVPAHFIQSISASIGGKTVFAAQTSTSVSRNPVFGFKVKGAKSGDKVVVTWKDNRGETRTDEATIG
jgi:sulfur-oxidizing protein SoxZ